jgi:hypothetical protein
MYGGMFNGAMVILNDQVYTDGNVVYHSYLFMPGAAVLGYQTNFNTEAFRQQLTAAGTDVLKYALAYCAHVPGASYTGTVPSVIGGITDAALFTGSNWTARTSINASEIGIIAIETVEA